MSGAMRSEYESWTAEAMGRAAGYLLENTTSSRSYMTSAVVRAITEDRLEDAHALLDALGAYLTSSSRVSAILLAESKRDEVKEPEAPKAPEVPDVALAPEVSRG